jgi:hypothetical protein
MIGNNYLCNNRTCLAALHNESSFAVNGCLLQDVHNIANGRPKNVKHAKVDYENKYQASSSSCLPERIEIDINANEEEDLDINITADPPENNTDQDGDMDIDSDRDNTTIFYKKEEDVTSHKKTSPLKSVDKVDIGVQSNYNMVFKVYLCC